VLILSEYIAIYKFLLSNDMSINKEKTLTFLEDLKNNILSNNLDVDNTLIELICYAISICETKAQLKIICEYIDYIKQTDEPLFIANADKLAFRLSQNTKVFKTLKNIVTSQSYMDTTIYSKVIEKYVKNKLDTISEITPAIKEDMEYYDEIINTLDVIDNETLKEYKTQIEMYKDTIIIQEMTEESILNEIMEMKQEETEAL